MSPIAIAGVILAENTLNTHPAGYQDYAEQLHKNICKGMSQSAAETDAGNYAYQQALLEGQFKKHVSMGIGAVKCSTAQTVEKLVEE
ncbi:hypothetical protein, partial [Pseudomonas sp. FW306-02-H05-AA]|uniref:hypothetical protein n=1 Tax=Pseudomonas sp. FW306-02-H05-AA TaxID=2070657 RepID=UPI0011AFBD8D